MRTVQLPYPKIYLYRRVVQAKLFIDQKYADAIDLSQIADEACFSRFHFIRLFKKIYNRTPHQYLTGVRILKAKRLLSEGMSVADTCFMVGFDSVTSFTGLFKRMNAVTPAAYRARQSQLQADIKEAPLRFIPNCFAESHGWTQNSNFQEGID